MNVEINFYMSINDEKEKSHEDSYNWTFYILFEF
jgi:hypothetical protein